MTLIEKIQKIQSGELKATPELITEIENELQLLIYKPYDHTIDGPPAKQAGLNPDDVEHYGERGAKAFNGMKYSTGLAKLAENLENASTKRELALLMAGAMKKHAEQNMLSKLQGLAESKEKLKEYYDEFMKSRKFNTDNT